ncbi:MAG: PAS domain S-box protein [Acidobacteria bacterium]|nr:PAS domain S-box protein [Acidobacteriota bacterium]
MHSEPLPSWPAAMDAYRRHRAFLESTPLAVVDWNPEGVILGWNPAAERMFGYAAGEILGQAGLELLLPAAGRAWGLKRLEQMRENPEPLNLSAQNLHKDGRILECDWHLSPLHDEDGGLLGFTAMVLDQTERRQSEEALRLAQKLESLGVLAGGIAHDFNNLLTAILGHVDLALGKTDGSHPATPHLNQIDATARRAAELSRQMLAYSGRGPFHVSNLDLNRQVREMAGLLSVSVAKKVVLEVDLEDPLPGVKADAAQFQQVILNLVTNASEAIGERGGRVCVRTRSLRLETEDLASEFPGQVLEPGHYVRLEVSDDGCGMDAETIGRIFDPFFTTKFTGRGLGLSAMLGIVRGHRAGIRVDSRPGQGTTFILIFPAGEEAPAEDAPAPPPAAHSLAGRVLVVDDEEIVRELACLALEPLGLEVLLAQDGLEAVATVELHGHHLDLLLMDLTMPRMDGAEAFRIIRALHPRLPVILTSGYTEAESLRGMEGLQPEAFLQKPFRVPDLQVEVGRMLALHR